MINTIKRYRTKQEACRFTAKRSLFAHRRGEYSQFEVRSHVNGYFGGPCCDFRQSPLGSMPVVAQYSGGYHCS